MGGTFPTNCEIYLKTNKKNGEKIAKISNLKSRWTTQQQHIDVVHEKDCTFIILDKRKTKQGYQTFVGGTLEKQNKIIKLMEKKFEEKIVLLLLKHFYVI